MQVEFQRPSLLRMNAFSERASALSLSYTQEGYTQQTFPPGYDHDHYRFEVGRGAADFNAACRCVQRLGMFPGWARVYLPSKFLGPGKEVTVIFRLLGLHWYNACRIIYLIDEPCRFGFAYGTLTAHVECGEERFLISQSEDGTVCYYIDAFSRPAHWLACLGYPFARRFQKQFARDSAATLSTYVKDCRDAR